MKRSDNRRITPIASDFGTAQRPSTRLRRSGENNWNVEDASSE